MESFKPNSHLLCQQESPDAHPVNPVPHAGSLKEENQLHPYPQHVEDLTHFYHQQHQQKQQLLGISVSVPCLDAKNLISQTSSPVQNKTLAPTQNQPSPILNKEPTQRCGVMLASTQNRISVIPTNETTEHGQKDNALSECRQLTGPIQNKPSCTSSVAAVEVNHKYGGTLGKIQTHSTPSLTTDRDLEPREKQTSSSLILSSDTAEAHQTRGPPMCTRASLAVALCTNTNLGEQLYALQCANVYTDTAVVFCESEAPVYAHAAVLASRMRMFKYQVIKYLRNSDSNMEADCYRYCLDLRNISTLLSKEDVNAVIQYCYIGKWNSTSNMGNIFLLAKYLELDGLAPLKESQENQIKQHKLDLEKQKSGQYTGCDPLTSVSEPPQNWHVSAKINKSVAENDVKTGPQNLSVVSEGNKTFQRELKVEQSQKKNRPSAKTSNVHPVSETPLYVDDLTSKVSERNHVLDNRYQGDVPKQPHRKFLPRRKRPKNNAKAPTKTNKKAKNNTNGTCEKTRTGAAFVEDEGDLVEADVDMIHKNQELLQEAEKPLPKISKKRKWTKEKVRFFKT